MKWIIIAAIAAFAVFGLTLVHEVPYTPDDAMAGCASGPSDFVWTCPAELGTKECRLQLEIPDSEFDRSMHQNVFRTGTVFSPSPVSFVSPSDSYVQRIAEHIESETEGLSPYLKATAALWFVQCTIGYSSDSALFGTENFWTFPLETLYLRQGDCEDTSVLLASIMEAMGFDTVLLDYEGHMAVGVRLDEDVIIDDLRCARRILRMDIRRRKVIPQHLAVSTSPLTSKETPNEMDPEAFTIEHAIKPLLNCLGYTKGNITSYGGRGKSDILLTLKGCCIVLEAKPIYAAGYEEQSSQIFSYVADNRDNNCIWCREIVLCMGSVLEVGLESLFRGETLQADVADGAHDPLDVPVLEDVPADGHAVSSGVQRISDHVQDVHVGVHLGSARDDHGYLCAVHDPGE